MNVTNSDYINYKVCCYQRAGKLGNSIVRVERTSVPEKFLNSNSVANQLKLCMESTSGFLKFAANRLRVVSKRLEANRLCHGSETTLNLCWFVWNHSVWQAELSSARLLSTAGLAVPHGSSATWFQRRALVVPNYMYFTNACNHSHPTKFLTSFWQVFD